MTESDLHVADVVALEHAFGELHHEASIYRDALFVALTLLHGAALRLLDQDTQLRQLLAAHDGV